jgi:hypothetical protein
MLNFDFMESEHEENEEDNVQFGPKWNPFYKPHPCERCGATNTEYVEDPYNSEILDDHEMHWFCPDCYRELIQDI